MTALVPSFSGTEVTLTALLNMQKFAGQCQPDGQNKLLGNGNIDVMNGSSTDFDYIRPMVASDDFRHIDARATARSQNIMVRTFLRENQRNIKLFLDCSPSMNFGDRKCTKLVAAMQYISLLSWSAVANQCTFDIYCFNATDIKVIQLDIKDEFDLRNAFSRLVLEVNKLLQAADHPGHQQQYKLTLASMLSALQNNAQVVLLSDLVYLVDVLLQPQFNIIATNTNIYILCPTTALESSSVPNTLSIGATWQFIPASPCSAVNAFLQSAQCHWSTHQVGNDIPLRHWFG